MKNPLIDFYRGRKVFITGHTGFKGSWLTFWLTELGAEITGYALAPEYENSLFKKLELSGKINNYIADIRDLSLLVSTLERSKPEIVFHLAAQALVRKSYHDPLLTFSTNVMGSLNLLEAVRHCESVKSLVYITSDKCYWNNEWVWGYRESDPLGGPDPYSASKACAEHIFKSYYLSYFKDRENLGVASTRAGNVIGGGDCSVDRLVPDIIRAIEKATPIVLRHPQATRPWQHVMDPLHGYLQLAMHLYKFPEKYNGEAWNFGPFNHSIKTVRELTEVLINSWKDISIEMPPLQNQFYESHFLHLSIDKALTLLQWEPKLHFLDAVITTGEWYKRVQKGENPKEVTQEQIAKFMYV